MSNCDKMVEISKEQSQAKIELAHGAIGKLMENNERVTVSKLMKMTDLSRGFFYKNPTIRREIDLAMEQQAGMIDPRRGILDKAMETQVDLLHQQTLQWKQENELLKRENEKLKKAFAKKNLNMIKNL